MKICSWHPALECIFSWKLVSGYLGGGDKTASSHSRSILRLMASSSFIIESKDSLCLKLHANGEKCFPCSKLSIHKSALEHSLLEIRDDRALQPGTSLTWFLLSQAWAECLKCKMNKAGYFCLFVLSEGEHSFIFHSLLHSLADVKWAEVKQQEKKKKAKRRDWASRSLWQISSGSQCLQLTPVLKHTPWAEFSSNFFEFHHF